MACHILVVTAVGLMVAADAPDDKTKRGWTAPRDVVLVAIEEAADRLEVPPEARRKRLEISGNNIDTYWMNTCELGTFKMDADGKGIDIVRSGSGSEKAAPAKCLYRVNGDTLTLAASFFHAEDRPSSFETKDGNGVAVLTYRRRTKEPTIPGVEEEQKKLEGNWQLVSVTEDGQTAPEDFARAVVLCRRNPDRGQ